LFLSFDCVTAILQKSKINLNQTPSATVFICSRESRL